MLNGIKSMYVNSLACVRVEGVRLSASGVYHVPLAFQCINGRSDEGGKNGDGEEERL